MQAGDRATGKQGVAGSLGRFVPVVVAILIACSLYLPWWSITVRAPQYPQGLTVSVHLTDVRGDVDEIDLLNHYIGMMSLRDAAPVERRLAPYLVYGLAALTLAAAFLRGRAAVAALLPAILFPLGVVVDLYRWLYIAGHTLDPAAPLSSSIKPFTPVILGTGQIAQFSTVATFRVGFYVALVAAILAAWWSWRQAGRRGHGRM